MVDELLEILRRKSFDHREDSPLVVTACIGGVYRIGIFLVLNDPKYCLPSLRSTDSALEATRGRYRPWKI